MMKVEIVNFSKYDINESHLIRWVKSLCTELKKRKECPHNLLDKNLTLAFVGEQEIKELNKTFRNKNSVTDVLSFAPVDKDSMGELALCLPVILQKEKKNSKEWLYYLILHGMLHLMGFDHEKDQYEAQKMYGIQDSVFQKLIRRFQ